LPYNAEDYVHRIGRTGRAGASGDAISIYSDKDERLLADIEKLIKQAIPRGDLGSFVPPAPGRGMDAERGERRPRRDADSARPPASAERPPARGERSERPDRGARPPSSGYAGYAGNGRRDKVDPWFLKPYEPAKAAAPVASTTAPGSGKAKPKLAALLGGLPKA
jgi:ATP-dependent RNA helicase RhlE